MNSGFSMAAGPFPVDDVEVLFDTTAHDANGQRVCDRHILDAVCALICSARKLALVDFFLWNDWGGLSTAESPSNVLVDALLRLRRTNPEVLILVLTDPINRVYGETPAAPLARLIEGGVTVVWTDLDQLPDANRIYSPIARLGARLTRQSKRLRGLIETPASHPFDPSGPSVRWLDLLKLLHFKANHRKVVVADAPDGTLQGLVASFNPHDGSAAHTNVALRFGGAAARAAALGEIDCMAWSARMPGHVSGATPDRLAQTLAQARQCVEDSMTVRTATLNPPVLTWLTESAIRRALLQRLAATGKGDVLRIALFYLSDRGMVDALVNAVYRGAAVRLILDPNRDAFGRTKNGIPNRVTAAELQRRASGPGAGSLAIRWADTRGEQFHPKAICLAGPGGDALLLGSANWTRRNLAGYNLEADALLEGAPNVNRVFCDWFDARWDNTGGYVCTRPLSAFAEKGLALFVKSILYRVQETTGLGTF